MSLLRSRKGICETSARVAERRERIDGEELDVRGKTARTVGHRRQRPRGRANASSNRTTRRDEAMSSITKITDRKYRARWRTPDGASRTRTFSRIEDARQHLATVEVSRADGTYIDSAARRVTFGEYAAAWIAAQPHRATTAATTTATTSMAATTTTTTTTATTAPTATTNTTHRHRQQQPHRRIRRAGWGGWVRRGHQWLRRRRRRQRPPRHPELVGVSSAG